ncbi:MAG: N-acetyl-gamma-glutamyl-phosphate reductase [Bacillus thermozeamaize]|uniref:N-acetyl-gamma-glutamyl-phosphate reductase n=1 Tax=Bacillus thermozeamaize TaxID=230954 RepID=A0A1Y3PN69_9BACI|nr:MAG: N-acetyl-gamma-glutamyl-phosphate reductase [Bacillus thermozeamaize]
MQVAIVGASGYGGAELYRLLQRHPEIEEIHLFAHSQADQPISAIFPHIGKEQWVKKFAVQAVAACAEWVFLATPSGVSAQVTPQLVEAGLKVIDLSGDLRLAKPADYEEWYGKTPAPASLLEKAVYGLTELYRDAVRTADLIANPGCYPTATLLGLAPLLQEGLIETQSVIVDAKSGVSGAGRSSNLTHSFSEVNENLKVYRVNKHQHIPEIERFASQLAGEPVQISFLTHLIPMTRGMMCTIYATPRRGLSAEKVHQLYRSYYEDARFVRVRPLGQFPATKEVYGSNYCDLGVAVDQRTGRITVVSVIDNLVKGAAGQAVQNLNVRMGWPEALSLEGEPLFP